MKNITFTHIFGNNVATTRQAKRQRGRMCRVEELENREMLSVTPWLGVESYDNIFPYEYATVYESFPMDAGFEQIQSAGANVLTDTEFASIRAQFANLNLEANMMDYNIIVIDAMNLSDRALRYAIDQAGQNNLIEFPGGSLIVLQTIATQNEIRLTGSELLSDIDTAIHGSVTIVSFSDSPLSIDADEKSRVFSIAEGSTVTLAGLTITDGGVVTDWNEFFGGDECG